MRILIDLTETERVTIRDRAVAWVQDNRANYVSAAARLGVSLTALKLICSGRRLPSDCMVRRMVSAVPGLAIGIRGVAIRK